MNIDQFREAIFREATALGAEFAEISYGEGKRFAVQVQDHVIDEYEVATTRGLSLRVHYKTKEGHAYTEVMDDARELVLRAIDNASVIEDKDIHPVQGAQVYREVTRPTDPLAGWSEQEKIDLAHRLEEAALLAPEVTRVHGASVSSTSSRSLLANSLGLYAERESESSTVMLAPILERDGELQDSYVVRFDERVTDIDGIVSEAVEKAAKRFGGSPVAAGVYDIILSKEAARSLLGGFWSIFSAEQSQKNLSFLTGLLGQQIAADSICLVSDPYLATNPIVFDGEGSPAEALTVIEDGVFLSFLHNLKTAHKAGQKTTGHASSMGVGISPGNLYIKAGETKQEDLADILGDGLLIDQLSGLHAGLNAVSGEFSLLAKGQLIQDGLAVRPVEEITIAGNYRDFLMQISHVADDLYFGGRGGIGSPSLIVRGIKVGGR